MCHFPTNAARAILALIAGLWLSAASPAFVEICKPIAQGPMRVIPASLRSDEARITFVGHSTFLIETARGVTISTDHNDVWKPPSPPRVATMNRAHSTHFTLNPEREIEHVLHGWGERGEPARHDLQLLDVRIRNVPTNIRGFDGRTLYDGNSVFVFETAGLCIAHLGHLHHSLTREHFRELGNVDVVLVPVDGIYTMGFQDMVDVLKAMDPAIIIPMHFFNPWTLERFLAGAAQHWPIERQADPVITVSRRGLAGRDPRVVVLPGR